ncbi:MAG TPA: response regulator [Spirochaetota bacterium]|nr:response regulator [Spirochaetota bacterium]
MILSLTGIVGHIFQNEYFYATPDYGSIALHTASLFFIQSTALFFTNPSPSAKYIISSKFIGSLLFRRAFPVVSLIVFMLGWLRLIGQDMGYYDTRYGLSIYILTNIIIFTIMLWISANNLNNIDQLRRKADQNLMESEIQYRSLFDISLTGIAIGDPSKTLVKANKALIEMFGYAGDEFYHKTIIDLFVNPEDYKRVTGELYKSGRVNNLESLFKRKDGSTFTGLINSTMFNKQMAQAVIVDITSLKETQNRLIRSEERYRSTLDNMLEGCQIIGFDWRYIYVNDAAVEHGQKTKDELLGHTMMEAYPGIDSTELFSLIKNCLEDRVPYRLKNEFVYPDKKIAWFNLIIDPVPEGAFIFSTDISEQVKAEDDLRKLNSELEQRIEIRTYDLKQSEERYRLAKEAAEKATRSKSEFLANMSHEIRTPLNAIIGMNYILNKTELSPKQQDYSNKIMISSQNLLGVINDILDFSKIEAGKLEIESIPFNLNSVIENVSSVISIKAQEKGIEFIIDLNRNVPDSLIGDPLRLGQVLLNLTGNAIKFTETGEVVINIECTTVKDGRALLKFSIRDTGIGITDEQRVSLFKSFGQADASTTRKHGGTGLGLSISKRLVEMMGGEIGVESTIGKGSTFSFILVFETGEKKAGFKNLLPEDLKGKRVLVVDDNESSRMVLESYLKNFHFNPSNSSSGEEAISELHKASSEGTHYELILMDWRMPGLDGISTARLIRNDTSLEAKPKIIMVTAFGREDVIKDAESAGLDGFLVKPVTPSLLFDTIMSIFKHDATAAKGPAQTGQDLPDGLDLIRGARILVAEDNEINQEVVQTLLDDRGFAVSIAADGSEAVRMVLNSVETAPYDAVLMDLQMPIMDGYETTVEIRKDSRFNDLPIIAMTADAMSSVYAKVMAAGMNHYLTKPIIPAELFAALVQWIKPVSNGRQNKNYFTEPASENTALDLPESLPGLNLASGVRRIGGNKEKYYSLLLKFSVNQLKTINELQAALDRDDIETAGRLAHTIKGVAGNIGADELMASALSLESAIKSDDREIWQIKLTETGIRMKEVLKSIVSIGGEDKADGPGENVRFSTSENDPIKPLLLMLKQSLENNDTKSSDYLIRMREQAGVLPLSGIYNQMQQNLDKYDFEGALNILKTLTDLIGISDE